MAELILFDTTLRDGEQSRDFNPGFEQRLGIALALDRAGVDVIELASAADDEARLADSKKIAGCLENATACCIATVDADEIDAAQSVLADAARSRIHLYLDARRVHAMNQSEADRETALTAVATAIESACGRFDQVQFSPQDASRADPQSLRLLAACALAAGAKTFGIADTVGTATPDHMRDLFEFVGESFARDADAVLAIHAHNHHGNAVDNVLAAIDHGARQVEGTLGGVGPAGGNTNLLEVIARLPAGQRHEYPDPDSLRQLV